VHFAIGNTDKRGDIAVQVQQRMHLDSGFVLPEFGPREQGQAQIDGRGIQCVKALRQVDADWIAGVEWSCDPYQNLREVRKDAPVVGLVRIGQIGTGHSSPKSHVVEFAAD